MAVVQHMQIKVEVFSVAEVPLAIHKEEDFLEGILNNKIKEQVLLEQLVELKMEVYLETHKFNQAELLVVNKFSQAVFLEVTLRPIMAKEQAYNLEFNKI